MRHHPRHPRGVRHDGDVSSIIRSTEIRSRLRKWFDYSAQIVVIKHGKEGSIAYTQDGAAHRAKSFPAKVVKTFGAGDSYAAGFLYGVMQGWTIEKSMEFGSAALVSSFPATAARMRCQLLRASVRMNYIEADTAIAIR